MKKLIIPLLLLAVLSSCSKDENESIIESQTYQISGYVQKGPFISGTNIVLSELDSVINQTGKSFNSEIINNNGSFSLNNVVLESPFVSITAQGFYFNEILNRESTSQITLKAICDLTDKSTVNINILSHLEKARTEYLINEGSSFDEAKNQAQSEVLSIFNMDNSDMGDSEDLNITESGDANAKLLAASAILLGYRSDAELTLLLSNISNDIRTDGILNDEELGSELINHAVFLKANDIQNNLIERYSNIGQNFDASPFDAYIQNFIDSTDFEITGSIVNYPENGAFGTNVLNPDIININSALWYSLAANAPEGIDYKVIITSSTNTFWFMEGGTEINWTHTIFNYESYSQIFTSVQSGLNSDLKIQFEPGTYTIDYYEISSDEPDWTKTITSN